SPTLAELALLRSDVGKRGRGPAREAAGHLSPPGAARPRRDEPVARACVPDDLGLNRCLNDGVRSAHPFSPVSFPMRYEMHSAHESVAATSSATKRERLLIAAHRGEGVDSSGDQLSALIDVAKALSGAGIQYAVIGGIAVGIHSQVPRATQDID